MTHDPFPSLHACISEIEKKQAIIEYRVQAHDAILDRCDVLVSRIGKLVTGHEVQNEINKNLERMLLEIKLKSDKTSTAINELQEGNRNMTRLVYATPIACVTIILSFQKLFPL